LKQPAARQRVGEWAVLAALLVAVLRLGPTWLPVPWETAAHAEALPADVYDWAVEPRPAEALPVIPMQGCPSPPAPAVVAARGHALAGWNANGTSRGGRCRMRPRRGIGGRSPRA